MFCSNVKVGDPVSQWEKHFNYSLSTVSTSGPYNLVADNLSLLGDSIQYFDIAIKLTEDMEKCYKAYISMGPIGEVKCEVLWRFIGSCPWIIDGCMK